MSGDVYQCSRCLALGDGRTFSAPDSGLCDACRNDKDDVRTQIRELIAPYLNRHGASEVGDLARSIRRVLSTSEEPK